MQFGSRHLRALVPTAVTAGRLGRLGGSQRADAAAVRPALLCPQPSAEGEHPSGARGRRPGRCSRLVSAEDGKRGRGVWNRLLDADTPVRMTIGGPSGSCHLSHSLSLARASRGFGLSLSLVSLGLGPSGALSGPVAGECWLSRSPCSFRVRQGRAPLTSSLGPEAGSLPAVSRLPERAGLRLPPSGELHPLVPGGARPPRCRLSPAAHRLGGPPAT